MKKLDKVVIYSHSSGGTGNYDDMLFEYLLEKKVKDISKLSFPFDPRFVKTIRFKKFINNQEVLNFESVIKFNSPMLLSYIKDLIVGFIYGLYYLKNTELFIATNNLLSFIGIVFKKLGYVKSVTYVIIDYSPTRFSNLILNSLYYYLDKFALYNSDTVFSLNEEMILSRIKDRNLDAKKINFFLTPIGNNSSKREESDYHLYDENTIVYFGDILKGKGVNLFVPIMESLIKKGYKCLKFMVIGGGDLSYLKKEIEKASLGENFVITGRIDSHLEIEKLLLGSSIALAPYLIEDINSISFYSDPGKVKNYLGCGLPVVITPVPPIYKTIKKEKAGIVTDYNAEEIAEAIIEIHKNLNIYRKNAKELGKYFDWYEIFDRYFNMRI
jgi:glycosyltransferase involved in cell wall biosynthesis